MGEREQRFMETFILNYQITHYKEWNANFTQSNSLPRFFFASQVPHSVIYLIEVIVIYLIEVELYNYKFKKVGT